MTTSAADPARWVLDLRAMRPLIYRTSSGRTLADVTMRPFDAWHTQGVRRLAQARPDHVLHLVAPDLDTDGGGAVPGSVVNAWRAADVVTEPAAAALFAWSWNVAGHQVHGIAGAAALPLGSSTVPHEKVQPELVRDRRRQLAAAAVQAEPIVVLHDGPSLLTEPVLDITRHQAPLVSLQVGDESHRIWRIADPDRQATIRAALTAAGPTVVADGHHRLAALDGLVGSGWSEAMVLVVDTSASDLTVGTVHRVVPGLGPDAAAERVGAQTTALTDGSEDGWLAAADPGHVRWVLADRSITRGLDLTVTAARALEVAGPGCSATAALDTCLLHSHLLPAWAVDEQQVDFVHDWEQARAIASARGGVAVRTSAPRLAEIIKAARSGHLLPQKSTSIGPKPRLGLLMLSA